MSGNDGLVAVVTTDLAAITRGRFIAAKELPRAARKGLGWVPANLSITAFNSIASGNPWGSRGDLRMMPDLSARYRTARTGSATPFDLVFANLVELDGTTWSCCPRTLLREALAALKSRHGLTLDAGFEQEFQLFGDNLPPAHSFSVDALRRTDPFAPRLMNALEEAGVKPEMVIPEYGQDQFEVTCAPADALAAADRGVVIREITRETARVSGWRASFAPKTAPEGVGNGVHVHFSLRHADGAPATFSPGRPGRLSEAAASFCAGILRHLPALTALTAPSVPSYYRLKPHAWSASFTWIAERNREASLRICPVPEGDLAEAARQMNVEYRAADATSNPHLVTAALVRAGLAGLDSKLPCPKLVDTHPAEMSASERGAMGLSRLPESLPAALEAFVADDVAQSWFHPRFIESFLGVRRQEMELLANLDEKAICERYRLLY